MKKRITGRLDEHQQTFVRLVRENAHRHRPHEVFRDFCEMSALSISNAVDLAQFAPREARYLEIAKGYERAELDRFAHMLACVVESLEAGMHDCLGQLFMGLEFGDAWRGQFFTPYEVSFLMARVTMHDAAALIAERGFVTISEPAAGAGGMVVAMAHALQELGINYQQAMHVTACDIDATAAHMCYLQCSLLHIPATVVHGNSLALTEWGHWHTPAHMLGRWDARLRSRSVAVDVDVPSGVDAPHTPASASASALAPAAVVDDGTQLAVAASVKAESSRQAAANDPGQLDLFG